MALKAKTGSDSSIFDELANFGMKYHHALAELIDNSISSADANKISTIEIVVSLKEMKSKLILMNIICKLKFLKYELIILTLYLTLFIIYIETN